MEKTLLTEADGYALLARCGIPVPRHAVARTAEEAVAAARTIGFPVVMKVISPQVVHKSDAGGVVAGIMTPEEAAEAFTAIPARIRTVYPGAEIAGIMVEQQLPAGLEILIGGTTDAAFGKTLTVGMGGRLVELVRDVSTAVLPVDGDEIRRMVRRLRGYPLIAGYRKEAPRDEEALVRMVSAAAQLFLEDPSLAEFDINPLVLYESGACAVDARFYRSTGPAPAQGAAHEPMPPSLLSLQSIAVVGASSDPSKVGYAICRNMLGFPGALWPVNKKAGEILGRKAYPTLAEIPGPVDAVVIAVPAAGVPQVLAEAGEKKIPLAIIITSGFRESGEEGRRLEAEVVSAAARHKIRIMGPNCLGLMLPVAGINTTFDPVSPRPGRIAFISQSGAIITTIVDWSLPEEIGFSAVISVGNQADLTFEDFVRFAGSDAATRAIILYIEQIRDGREFLEIVQAITPEKPVVAIKSGSSAIGQKAASSHTGSLAGSASVYLAAFRQAGIIPVRSIREAFQAAELLASEGYPGGIRAVVISNAGGFAVLASDYAERFGIRLVEFPPDLIAELDAALPRDWSRQNPIDMVGDSSADRYAKTFDIMIARQDLWDIAFVIAVPSAISDPIRVANELVRFSRHTHKMIVGCMIGGDSMKTPVRILRDANIPNFPDLEDAFRSVGNICRHVCDTTEACEPVPKKTGTD